MAGGGSKPGERRGGRGKGSPNKLTRELREMVLGALDDAGGQAYLAQQARDNPGAFMALLGKCLPKDINLAGQVGTYVAQPIPVESRESDSMADPKAKADQ